MTGVHEEPISFAATTTLGDIVAANAHLQSPAAKKRKGRAWRGPAFVAACVMIGLFGGTISSSDEPITAAKQLLTPDFALRIVVILVLLAAMSFLATRALRLVNKFATRRIYANTRASHPAVDASDPTLRMARLYRFDETGMTTTTDFDEIWEAWPRITGLDETPTLLIVRVGSALGYPLPKRQLPEDLQERLHRFIAGRSHSKWPF